MGTLLGCAGSRGGLGGRLVARRFSGVKRKRVGLDRSGRAESIFL